MNPMQIAALRQSLTMKLRAEAERRKVAADQIRKQYVFAVFLGQLFRDPDAPWVLMGGNALLIRTGGGKFTQDIDLARASEWPTHEDARNELQALLTAGRGEQPV